jgi:hypothetical protein
MYIFSHQYLLLVEELAERNLSILRSRVDGDWDGVVLLDAAKYTKIITSP